MTPEQEERLVVSVEKIAKAVKKIDPQLFEYHLSRLADVAEMNALLAFSDALETSAETKRDIDNKLMSLVQNMTEEEDDDDEDDAEEGGDDEDDEDEGEDDDSEDEEDE